MLTTIEATYARTIISLLSSGPLPASILANEVMAKHTIEYDEFNRLVAKAIRLGYMCKIRDMYYLQEGDENQISKIIDDNDNDIDGDSDNE